MMKTRTGLFAAAVTAAGLLAGQAQADVIEFTFTSTASTAGADLVASGSHTASGITLTATPSAATVERDPNIAIGATLTADGNGMGVNGQYGSDTSGEIDYARGTNPDYSSVQTLTLVVTFGGSEPVSLESLGFYSLDSSAPALITIGSNPTVEVVSGDTIGGVYTFGTPVDLTSGDSIVFTQQAGVDQAAGFKIGYQLASMTVNVVPEPASLALLGLGSLMVLGRARRTQA